MIDKVNMNFNYSKELCNILNKDCKEPVKYSATASSDTIGIRQELDGTGLAYNEIFYTDTIKDNYSINELVNVIYASLGTGRFNYVFPTEKEKEIYNKLTENNWQLTLDKGELVIDEGIAIEDILNYEITNEFVKFEVDEEFYGYKVMKITKDKVNDDFDIEYIE